MWKPGPIGAPVHFAPARPAFERLQFEGKTIQRVRCAPEKLRGFSALKTCRAKVGTKRRRLIDVHGMIPTFHGMAPAAAFAARCSSNDPWDYPVRCLVSNNDHCARRRERAPDPFIFKLGHCQI
jgi:hypothetical protein